VLKIPLDPGCIWRCRHPAAGPRRPPPPAGPRSPRTGNISPLPPPASALSAPATSPPLPPLLFPPDREGRPWRSRDGWIQTKPVGFQLDLLTATTAAGSADARPRRCERPDAGVRREEAGRPWCSCSSSSTPPLVPVFLGSIFISYKDAASSPATGMVTHQTPHPFFPSTLFR
jgi:hypothetical protein